MIAWSLETALASALFDHVLVSTDDEEIASIARELGAEVPFMRPAALADDHTSTISVIRHALGWWEENRGSVSLGCCVYPTAPFLRTEDLAAGHTLLQQIPDADYAVSITTFPFPIFRAVRRDAHGRIPMFWPENQLVRSQDLPEAWHDAAMFYWGKPAAWRMNNFFFSESTVGVPIPRARVQDIDTPEDWVRAEMMAASLMGEVRSLGKSML